MIGNISVCFDINQLNFVIGTRMNTKVAECISKNVTPPKCKVIVVDDYCPQESDYICASILLPDYKSMDALINGDYNQFQYFYTQKLMNDPNIKEYMAVILTGLMERNIDYVIYFDIVNNTNLKPIADILCGFLQNILGLILFTAGQIQMNPNCLFEQSMLPHFVCQNKMAIDSYGYSNRKPALFQSFDGCEYRKEMKEEKVKENNEPEQRVVVPIGEVVE